MASDKGDAAGYLGWFLFGATVGAVAAILGAPRTGRETREILAERSGEAQNRASEWLDKGRDLLEEQTQRLGSAFEAGRDAMREEIRKAPGPERS
jgi:gas vesicle protein